MEGHSFFQASAKTQICMCQGQFQHERYKVTYLHAQSLLFFFFKRNVATRWKEQGNFKSPSSLLAGDLGNRLPIAGYYCQGPGLLCSKLLAMATYCLWISVLAGTLQRGYSGQQGSRFGQHSQWSSLLNAEKSQDNKQREKEDTHENFPEKLSGF